MSRLSSLTPGLVQGISCVEASMIGTYFEVFGKEGTGLLWAVVLPFVLWPLIESTATTLGNALKAPLLTLVSKRFGDVPFALASISLLASNTAGMVVEVIAASASFSMLTGLPWPVFIPVVLSLFLVLPLSAGKKWGTVVILLSLPLLAFPAAAFLLLRGSGAAVAQVVSGMTTIKPGFKAYDVIAVLGATIAPDVLFFAEESGYAEGGSVAATNVGHLVAFLMSMSVAVTFSLGITRGVPRGLSGISFALRPVFGSAAGYAFPVMLLASCVASFVVALKPWISTLTLLTGGREGEEGDFVLSALALIVGSSLMVGLMNNWSALVFEQTAYTAGVISSVGLVFPLLFMSAVVVQERDKLPKVLSLTTPIYSAVVIGLVVYGLLFEFLRP